MRQETPSPHILLINNVLLLVTGLSFAYVIKYILLSNYYLFIDLLISCVFNRSPRKQGFLEQNMPLHNFKKNIVMELD